jgi:transcriptional regulator with XRE-family HTH domain
MTAATAEDIATPENPNVYRLGRVERTFRAMAEELGFQPGEFLQALLAENCTQAQLAQRIGCTRQAVGILASRYGLEFPGARMDFDHEATRFGATDFSHYVEIFGDKLTQREMAAEIGTSLSTIKRLIRKVLSAKEGAPRKPRVNHNAPKKKVKKTKLKTVQAKAKAKAKAKKATKKAGPKKRKKKKV